MAEEIEVKVGGNGEAAEGSPEARKEIPKQEGKPGAETAPKPAEGWSAKKVLKLLVLLAIIVGGLFLLVFVVLLPTLKEIGIGMWT